MTFLQQGGGKMKKVISLLICLLMCFSFSVTASAQTASASVQRVSVGVAQPYYEMANEVKSELNISGTTATCKSTVVGYPGVTKICVEQYLQRQVLPLIWTTYDGAEWIQTVYRNSYVMSRTKTGLTSGKYRLKSIFSLTDKNGKTEKITVYSDQVWV